jgi:hypothetical protein
MGIEPTSEVWEACNSNSTNAGLGIGLIFIDLKISQMENNGKRKMFRF